MPAYTIAELAERYGLDVKGDGQTRVEGICTLLPGEPGRLSFLSNARYREQLAGSAAAAIIVGRRDAAALPGDGLIADDAYLAYARIAALFDPDRAFTPGTHASAVVDSEARIGAGAWIGALTVIEAGAEIGEGAFIGPGCHVGRDARIGAGTKLVAQVHVGARVRIGARCHILPAAVIGSRGFGNAPSPQGWVEVPQLGSVIVGDDVEIGAGTTIDRGAIDDTVIGDGVKLDNQIQIAHNCTIGAHTAIAACTAMAGSTRIGARCMIGGAVGISGHLTIADDVVILGMAMVTKGLPTSGIYGSGLPIDSAREWRKQIARLRRLEKVEGRLLKLEQLQGIAPVKEQNGEALEPDDT